MRRIFPRASGLLLSICCVTIVGCVSNGTPAPVVDRAPSSGAPVSAQASVSGAQPSAETHIVQKGETVYSIGRLHNVEPKNIIAWNNLGAGANALYVGQVLRIAPPTSAPVDDRGVVVSPIANSSGVEVKPLGGEAASAPVVQAPAAANVKREPRGGKIPYSEQAWMQAKAGDSGKSTTAAIPPANPAEAKPETKPETKEEPKPDGRSSGSTDTKSEFAWPATGKVVGNFSESTNKGIDIGGKIGDAVLASAPGKVLYAGQDLRGYGKLVVVKHNEQFLSVYAHNSQILVKEGQSVTRGQKIAELGQSDAEQPKLHFEIRKQGKPVDPLQFLPAR